MILDVRFVSVWDDNIKISSNAKLNTETGLVFDIEQVENDDLLGALDILDHEYIVVPHGDRDQYEVSVSFDDVSEEFFADNIDILNDCLSGRLRMGALI